MKLVLALALSNCLILSAASFTAAASVPLVNIQPETPSTGGRLDEPNINGTWGWSFIVNSPLIVTHVGWYDENRLGLSHEHKIGLWVNPENSQENPTAENAEQLLFTIQLPEHSFSLEGVVIPRFATAELAGGYRRVPLPLGPLVLQPGVYFLGGLDNAFSADVIRFELDSDAETYPRQKSSFDKDPRIWVGQPGRTLSNDFSFSPPPSHGYFLVTGVELGPMLFVEPVPEPGCFILAIVGGFSLACSRSK